MLGLGSNLTKVNRLVLSPTTDNLVLKHDYQLRPVRPLSDGAASFDGTDDYIDVGSPSTGTGTKTISMWVNPSTTTSNDRIISNIDDINFSIRFDSSNVEIWGNSWETLFSNPSTATWTHFAFVFDGSTNVIGYKDGVAGSSVSTVYNLSNLGIGALLDSSIGTYYDGYICNVGIWDAALSQAQIKSIMWKKYSSLTSSEKTNLVSWWNLDSVIPDTTTFVYDNHHGGGNTLGSEIVADGDFALTGTQAESITGTYWTTAANWTISDEKAHVDSDSTVGLTQTIPLSVGATYFVEFTISNYTRGTLQIQFGGAVIGSGSADGTFSFYKTSTVTSTVLYCYAMSTPKFSIDNVSVKQVNGNTGTLS